MKRLRDLMSLNSQSGYDAAGVPLQSDESVDNETSRYLMRQELDKIRIDMNSIDTRVKAAELALRARGFIQNGRWKP